MTREEMLIRIGFYSGLASRLLGDTSYALRYRGRAELITEEIYAEVTREIQERLVAAGHIGPDEDPYDEMRKQAALS